MFGKVIRHTKMVPSFWATV